MALTALGTVLGFGVLGGGAAYAMTSGHSQAATPAATRTIQPSGSPKTTQPATSAPVPTRTVTVAPQTPATQTPAWQQPSSPAVPAQQFTNSVAVVDQFYQDITDHNYAAAWTLGGSNLDNGVGYDAWVAGYSTTVSLELVDASDWGSGAVRAGLIAAQSDGTTKIYEGTYYVSNGVITSANIVQTG